MVKIRPIATAIFNCCCLIMAAYMTIKQIGTYLRNEDESVISFEEIKETSSEDFATYTICLLMDNGAGMYKPDELIYSKRENIDEFGLGTSNNFLELDGNKLLVQNMSDKKGTGRQWSFYGKDNPLYGNWETNFFYDELYNPSRCDFGEIESMPTKVDVEGFVNCTAEREVVRTYNQHIQLPGQGSLMAFKRGDKVYAVDYYQYHDILMGSSTLYKFEHKCFEGEYMTCKMVPIKYTLEDVLNIDFDKNTEELSSFLLSHDIEYINGSKKKWFTERYRNIESNHSLSLEMSDGKESRNFLDAEAKAFPEENTRLLQNPLIKVYQDPTRKCYSPDLSQTLQKRKERITLNLEIMSETFELGYGGPFVTAFLDIHVHPQGQFVRTIGKEIATYIIEDFFVDCLEMGMGYFGGTCHGSSLTFDFSRLTLLKSRHDAEISCDKNLRNEDVRIVETLLNHTGIRCIPMYWKSILENQLNYSECTNESQYKMISELTANFASYEKLRSNFDPPCMEMMIVTNVNKEPGRSRRFYDIQEDWLGNIPEEMLYLDIAINHFSEQYQAIINTKVFTVESCWAGIGGFVGIFVGVSLMQVPDIIMETINLMMKLKEKVRK